MKAQTIRKYRLNKQIKNLLNEHKGKCFILILIPNETQLNNTEATRLRTLKNYLNNQCDKYFLYAKLSKNKKLYYKAFCCIKDLKLNYSLFSNKLCFGNIESYKAKNDKHLSQFISQALKADVLIVSRKNQKKKKKDFSKYEQEAKELQQTNTTNTNDQYLQLQIIEETRKELEAMENENNEDVELNLLIADIHKNIINIATYQPTKTDLKVLSLNEMIDTANKLLNNSFLPINIKINKLIDVKKQIERIINEADKTNLYYLEFYKQELNTLNTQINTFIETNINYFFKNNN